MAHFHEDLDMDGQDVAEATNDDGDMNTQPLSEPM